MTTLWIEERSEEREGGGGGAFRRTAYVVIGLDDKDDGLTDGELGVERELEDESGGGCGRGGATVDLLEVVEGDRCGSLDGTGFCFAIAFSQSKVIILSVVGLAREDAEMSSYDSVKLIESVSRAGDL